MAQIVTNTPLVERNSRIARILTLASVVTLVTPLLILLPSITSRTSEPPVQELLALYGLLILGLVLSNLGGYYMNRWGVKYFEKVNAALKGTDKKYRLYNYLLPVPNLLLTPYGVTVLLLKNVEGRIYADSKGWRTNVGIFQFLRWFSAERLGDPTKELEAAENKARAFISEYLGENFKPPVDGLIVFTNPKAGIEITNVELPVILLAHSEDSLKDALKHPKGAPQLSKADYDKLYALFEQEAEARRVEALRGLVIAGRKIF